MAQVIKQENPETTSGTNAVLVVLLVAILVAFGVWYFSQGSFFVPAINDDPGINVNVDLPAGGTGGAAEGNTNTGGRE